MEIAQLRAFHEIVTSGSYSKASKNLFITQSAISHQIKNLEKEIDIKLFERVGNTMKLTDGGKILSNAIDRFLVDLDNLRRISEEVRNSRTGNLTISATHGIMIHVLPKVIKRFRDEFPGVKLKLIDSSLPSEFLRMVSNGDVDLAIGPRANQELSDELNFLSWHSFGRILLTAKDHPLRKKKSIRLTDLCAHPLILYRVGTVTRKAVEDAFAKNKLHYEVIMESDTAETAKKCVEMDIGVSIHASYLLSPEDAPRFWSVDVSHLFGEVEVGVYYRKDKYVNAAMKQFIRLFAPELYESFLS